MIGTYLRVYSKDYNIEVPLERRVTYLLGDSVVGKTELVRRVTSYLSGDDSVRVEIPKRFLIAL